MKVSARVKLAETTVCLVLLGGCGGANPPSNPTPLSPFGITIVPSSASVPPGGTQQFASTVTPGGTNQAVTWSVSGPGCSGAQCGTIDASGKYTAPATVPNPTPVTVTARSDVDATNAGAATVTINTGSGNTGLGPISVAVAPDPSGKFGKFAYVANYRSNKIAMYTIDAATGALASTGTIDAESAPRSIAIDPSGRFAYVTNSASNSVSMYSIDGTGGLTLIGTVGS